MKALVGYTGFVGSNLAVTGKYDKLYNRLNILSAYNTKPDILVYAGVTGTKFVANKNPQKDRLVIENAIHNIKEINPRVLILISTIDVYNDTWEKSESDIKAQKPEHSYGKNRLILEDWVRNNIKSYHIIRLPALFGINLKKNFVYDIIHNIPPYLSLESYVSIQEEFDEIDNYFVYNPSIKMMQLKDLNETERNILKHYFTKSNYNSIYLTDSRSCFQYYNLTELEKHIAIIQEKDIREINLVTEPVNCNELYKRIYHEEFINLLDSGYVNYNLHTEYAKYFNNTNEHYILGRDKVINALENYISHKK